MVEAINSELRMQQHLNELERQEARHKAQTTSPLSFRDMMQQSIAPSLAPQLLEHQKNLQDNHQEQGQEARANSSEPESVEQSAAEMAQELIEQRRMLAELGLKDDLAEQLGELAPEVFDAVIEGLSGEERNELTSEWNAAQLKHLFKNQNFASQAEVAAENDRVPTASAEALLAAEIVSSSVPSGKTPELASANQDTKPQASILDFVSGKTQNTLKAGAQDQPKPGTEAPHLKSDNFGATPVTPDQITAVNGEFAKTQQQGQRHEGLHHQGPNAALGSTPGAPAKAGPSQPDSSQPFNTFVKPTPLAGGAGVDAKTLYTPSAAALDQIVMLVQKGADNGLKRLTMQLTPANLGLVDVQLEKDKSTGKITASLNASEEGTRDLLKKESGTLTTLLAQAGVDAKDVHFGLMNDRQQSVSKSFGERMKSLLEQAQESKEDAASEWGAGIIVYPKEVASDASLFLDIGA